MNIAAAVRVPIRTVMLHTLTGGDNKTFDFVRIGGFVLLLSLIGFQWANVSDFNPINFAGAGAAILAAIAGSDKLQDTPLNRPLPPAPEGPSTVVSTESVTIKPPK